MINKYILLSKKPKNNKIFNFLFTIILLTSIFFSYKYKTYDSYYMVGLKECEDVCYILISLSYKDINKISESSLIEYNNKKYQITELIYDEPYLNNNIAYQDVKIISNLETKESIINMKVLYNRQRILTKLKKIIFKEE